MKPIKFRAFHKEEKRFYYFDLETVTQTRYAGYYHPITGEKDCELDDYGLYTEKQLFTGLLDKNGVEIYEGDKIGIVNPSVEGSYWEIVWYDFGWKMLLCGMEDIQNYYVNVGKHLEDDEIIGNIWEKRCQP